MLYRLCQIFSILALSAVLAKAQAQNSPVEIAAEDAAPPWSLKDGSGFANDVIMAAFQSVNIQVKYVVESYEKCKDDVLKGKYAACLSMSADPAFKDKVIFSEVPVFECNTDYYYNTKKPVKAKREDQISKEMKIGVVAGYEYPDSVDQLKKKGIVFVEGPSEEVNLKKLAMGHIDLALINHNEVKTAASMIERVNEGRFIAFAFKSGRLDSFIGFSSKHPQGESLRKLFNEGFKKIVDNGTYHKLEIRWMKAALKMAN